MSGDSVANNIPAVVRYNINLDEDSPSETESYTFGTPEWPGNLDLTPLDEMKALHENVGNLYNARIKKVEESTLIDTQHIKSGIYREWINDLTDQVIELHAVIENMEIHSKQTLLYLKKRMAEALGNNQILQGENNQLKTTLADLKHNLKYKDRDVENLRAQIGELSAKVTEATVPPLQFYYETGNTSSEEKTYEIPSSSVDTDNLMNKATTIVESKEEVHFSDPLTDSLHEELQEIAGTHYYEDLTLEQVRENLKKTNEERNNAYVAAQTLKAGLGEKHNKLSEAMAKYNKLKKNPSTFSQSEIDEVKRNMVQLRVTVKAEIIQHKELQKIVAEKKKKLKELQDHYEKLRGKTHPRHCTNNGVNGYDSPPSQCSGPYSKSIIKRLSTSSVASNVSERSNRSNAPINLRPNRKH